MHEGNMHGLVDPNVLANCAVVCLVYKIIGILLHMTYDCGHYITYHKQLQRVSSCQSGLFNQDGKWPTSKQQH